MKSFTAGELSARLRRPYFGLCAALTALSIAFVASKIAYSLEIEMPVLEWPSSRCTVHLHPVGWADWMI
jgi:hypothetical protein